MNTRDFINNLKEALGNDLPKIVEEKEEKTKPTFLILTQGKDDGSKDKKSTAEKIEEQAKKLDIKCHTLQISNMLFDASSGELEIQSGKSKLKLKPKETVVFVRGSAVTDEGLALLSALERAGAMCINSYASTQLARNKLQTSLHFSYEGIQVPKTYLISNVKQLENFKNDLGFPIVVKPLAGAEGIGITLINDEKSLNSVVQNYFRMDDSILLQEFLSSPIDYRVLLIGGKVIAGTKRVKSDKDFRSNLGHGVERKAYKPNKKQIEWCEKVARLSGLYYTALDFVEQDGKLYLLEANGSPGSGSVYWIKGTEGEQEGDELVATLVKHVADTDNWSRAGKISGLIEWCSVEGMEPIHAKMDTGNESYNSIHATNVQIEVFDTELPQFQMLSENNLKIDEAKPRLMKFNLGNKSFEKPLVSVVKVRSGSDAQQRPVVELDVLFDGKNYEKVRFNLTDRSEKEYEILFGSKFMEDHCLIINPSKKFLLGEPSDEDVKEAVVRKNATKALRTFKTLLANLAPTVDVLGFEVEIDGVKVSANSDDNGTLTSLTMSGPGGRKLLRLGETPVDSNDFQAKLAMAKGN